MKDSDIYSLPEKNKMNYPTTLNEQQRHVVSGNDSASLVLAGPGSGKTRVLVHRVAHLIDKGVKPEEILLLTFTNKAAKEMLQRTEDLLKKKPSGLIGGTFHHVGNQILRRHAPIVGLQPYFSIIDREDSKQLLKDVIASIVPEKEKHFPSVGVVQAIMSFAANAQLAIKPCIEQKFIAYEKHSTLLNDISQKYAARKKKSNLVDFDDLLVHWSIILQNRRVCEYYQNTWKHILVDEFQDTNKLQFSIIRSLTAGGETSIMVVGDDCQSIYSFRAAEIANIIDFPKHYTNCKEYRLEVNYRSTPEIVHLVNKSIFNNKGQFKKVLKTENKKGLKPTLVRCTDAEQEAAFIARKIMEMKEKGMTYADIGVLFRAEYQSAQIELELTKQGIPFVKRGGLKFFEQAHIKDMTAFLKILNNEKDELAWKRVLCLFQGIGPAKSVAVWQWVSEMRDPLRHIKAADTQLFTQTSGWADFKRVIAGLPEVVIIKYFVIPGSAPEIKSIAGAASGVRGNNFPFPFGVMQVVI